MVTPEALFERIAAASRGRAALWLGAALAAWCAAAAAIAIGQHWVGAGLIPIAYAVGGVGEALARRRSIAAIDPLRTPLGFLLVPFGFALGDPPRALAAMFLTVALAVWINLGRAAASWLLALTALGFFLAALLPNRFSLLAYLIGIVCFVAAGRGAGRR